MTLIGWDDIGPILFCFLILVFGFLMGTCYMEDQALQRLSPECAQEFYVPEQFTEDKE